MIVIKVIVVSDKNDSERIRGVAVSVFSAAKPGVLYTEWIAT